ncbi:ABC transporter ATP-binding protein [Methanobrevibacter filiformis]|uniref:Bicarbonate transport ATP-binding protein CmpD n=1 Tax=Methanobrevibacter filiformis TaxID=55758 RepID=A0A162FEQ2_9EURY|nr:ABC transporter ATP-binding protein [Methanobrevibacter filiformis]KZX11955.1 bicarbonate transport ATP-binding protein CmpD [Methanobrevibacter filiformis]
MLNIDINNISMIYETKDSKVNALHNINLEINSGEFVSIIGPSGCGKSTLINIIAGIIKPTKGFIKVGDRKVENPNSDISVVFQDYSLFPWMTAYDNLHFAIKNTNKNLTEKEIKEKALKHLEIIGLSKFSNSFPKELSGGMTQKLAISRMFALDSKIFLLDEPFGALDALNRIHMQDLLIYLWRSGNNNQTILYITHDVDESIFLSDRIVVMTPSPGKIKEIIEIPFKRPRNRKELTGSKEYLSLRNHILSLLTEDMKVSLNKQEEQMRKYYD